ncbi:MAG: hypothetical protein ABR498_09740 [Candidatus Dormibacteria bacterium]
MAAGVVTTAASVSAPYAHASSPPHFAHSVPTEPGGAIGGTEPSAAVNADGERLVTWQGGDPVDISVDGHTWAQSTGGHDSGKCTDASGARELFDAGDVDIAIDADGHTAYVSSLAFNETDGIGIDIVDGTEQTDGSYQWSVANCHAGEPASDRPWIAAGPNHGDLVLYEKDLHLETPAVRVSHDGGHTFGPLSPALDDPRFLTYPAQVFNGNFAVAHDGTIYVPFLVPDAKDEAVGIGSSTGFPVTDVVVAVGKEDPTTHAVTFVDHKISPPATSLPSTANVAYIFASLALDSQDHPVVVWSEGATMAGPYDVYMSSCAVSCNDQVAEANPLASPWSDPVKVSGGPGDPVNGGSHVFPLVAAGTPGRLAVAWYGTSYTGDPTGGAVAGTFGSSPPPGAEAWRTYVAEATDWQPGSNAAPTFLIVDASGHDIHQGDVCIGGTFCDLAGAPTCPPVGCGDRSLFDNFGLSIDQAGGALVTWTDLSTKDSNGNTVTSVFAACQDAGTSLIDGQPDLNGCALSKFSGSQAAVPDGVPPLLAVAAMGSAGVVLRRKRRA